MITNELASEMIRRAILIAQKHDHAKGCYCRDGDIEARDGRGVCCRYSSVHARQFSIRGSVYRAAYNMGHRRDSLTAMNLALSDALGTVLGGLECMAEEQFACSLEDFNDRDETTRQDVLRLLFSVPIALPEDVHPGEKGMRHISKVVDVITSLVSKVQASPSFDNVPERTVHAPLHGNADFDASNKVEDNAYPVA